MWCWLKSSSCDVGCCECEYPKLQQKHRPKYLQSKVIFSTNKTKGQLKSPLRHVVYYNIYSHKWNLKPQWKRIALVWFHKPWKYLNFVLEILSHSWTCFCHLGYFSIFLIHQKCYDVANNTNKLSLFVVNKVVLLARWSKICYQKMLKSSKIISYLLAYLFFNIYQNHNSSK